MKSHKSNYELLGEWIEELSGFIMKDEFLMEIPFNEDEINTNGVKYRFYTDQHQYTITALDGPDGGFLGAVAICRKMVPGENFHRGDDLFYGPFRKDTWDRIIKDIVSYELIRVNEEDKEK